MPKKLKIILKKTLIILLLIVLESVSLPISAFAQGASDSAALITPTDIPSPTDTPAPQTTPDPTPTPSDWSDLLHADDGTLISPTQKPLPTYTESTSPSPTLTIPQTAMPSATLKPTLKIKSSSKHHFQPQEGVEFILESDPAVQYTSTLTYNDGKKETNIAIEEISRDGLRIIRLIPGNRLFPGNYTLTLQDWTGKTIRENFSWGVLAINPNRSVYLPSDDASFAIAVLDEEGQMVCDADLTLAIRRPDDSLDTLSTKKGTIRATADCQIKQTNSRADYEASYLVKKAGTYQLSLTATTKNGTFQVNDSFEVRDNIPFTIERTDYPSRLYPAKETEVGIAITAHEDFTGQIIETVPDIFEIASSSATPYHFIDSAISKDGDLMSGSDTNLVIRYPFETNYPITLKYGEKVLDDEEKDLYAKFGLAGHDGTDYALPAGTPVYAVDDGTVALAGAGAYGVTVVLQHSWGKSYYGHLQSTGLNVGQKVLKGYKIALSGSTGLSSGPHLHFGMKLNQNDMQNGYYGKIDPLPYLTGASIYPNYEARLIGWNMTMKKDQTKVLKYKFDAPDVSPQFYLVGPLRFYSNQAPSNQVDPDSPFVLGISDQPQSAFNPRSSAVFAEQRQWQIAVDALPSQQPPQVLGQQLPDQKSEKSVIHKGKPVNTNLKENSKAAARSRGENPPGLTDNDKLFRWEVGLPHGTTYFFGQQEKGGVLPVVKIRSKDGWFVEYEPISTDSAKSAFVKPKVNGNQIEWDIAPDITARYTALKDRIKADYVVATASALISANQLSFTVHYNDEYSGDNGEDLINGKGYLTHELLPDGTIHWLGETGGTAFEFPIPVVKDADGKEFKGTYKIRKISQGTSTLSILLPPDKLAQAAYPLTVDPVAIDSNAAATATAFANGRKLIKDPYGNLIVIYDGTSGESDDVYFKSYNATTWTDAGVNLAGTGVPNNISADIDANPNNENIHIAYISSADSDLEYLRLNVFRTEDNTIQTITANTVVNIDTTDKENRPSLIIANKGEGAGKEKVAIAWASNSTTGGTKQGEIRFLQCDIADDCTSATNWKNASEANSGTFPSGLETRGSADFMFAVDAHTTHHAVLTQVPGRPARTPTSATKLVGATYTDLTSALDDDTSTTSQIGDITTSDYLYIGDDQLFSRVVVNLTNTQTNNNADFQIRYCSSRAGDNSCATWSAASAVDNTASTAPTTFLEDGSILFDEPTNWVKAVVDGEDKYWIQLDSVVLNLDGDVTVAEFDVTDRHSKDLLIVGGSSNNADLKFAYVIWDFVGQAGWENIPGNTTAPAPWREINDGGILLGLSANWSTFTNFPLSATVDNINNRIYFAYVCDFITTGDCDASADRFNVESITNNVQIDARETVFPVVTEAADINFSITSYQNNIYLFYILDPGTNNLVWRRCDPRGGLIRDVCDDASDWSSENTLVVDATLSHPQAIVSKAYGDTVAIDIIYTDTTDTDVLYERHYVDNADKTIVVAASADDAYHRDCISGTDDQDISSSTILFGRSESSPNCESSVDAELHTGFRFPSVTVSQGATISSAYIEFRVSSRLGTSDINFTIYGEDADNAVTDGTGFDSLTNCTAPCSGAIDVLTKTTTSSTQAVNFATNTYRFEVTDIVQEIVCRGAGSTQPCVGNYNGSGSWASGNALAIVMISAEGDQGGVDNYISIRAQDDSGTTTLDPTLQINLGSSSKRYSSGVLKAPTVKDDLDHPVSTDEYTAINTDDSYFASVSASLVPSASSSASPIYLFKVANSNNNNTDNLSATAIVKSSIPPKSYGNGHASGRTIYLQLYHSTNGWETKASNTTTVADTDITLSSGTVTGSTSYYATESPGGSCTGSDCWASWRVYQDAGPEGNQILYVDNFSATFTAGAAAGPTNDQLLRHGNWFNSSGAEQSFTF